MHVLGHALAKRCHRRLLCEMKEAAERYSIVPQSRPSEKKAALGSSSTASHHGDGQWRITAERFSPMSFTIHSYINLGSHRLPTTMKKTYAERNRSVPYSKGTFQCLYDLGILTIHLSENCKALKTNRLRGNHPF